MSDFYLNYFTFCRSAQTLYVPSNWIFGQKSCRTQDKCALPPRQNVFPFGGQTRIAWTWKVCRNRCKLGQIQCCGSHGCAVPTDPWLFQKRRTDLERVAYLKCSKASSCPVFDKNLYLEYPPYRTAWGWKNLCKVRVSQIFLNPIQTHICNVRTFRGLVSRGLAVLSTNYVAHNSRKAYLLKTNYFL